MTRTIALAFLALGCGTSAPTYSSTFPDASADVAPAADAGSDAAADSGEPCPVPSGAQLQILCGGACIPLDNFNCGRCGNACANFQTCFINSSRPAESRCGFD